jgi:hypothetical protein
MLRVLDEGQFTYMPNGRSVYVQVNLGGKIAPLRSLAAGAHPG